jgi:hypothetical protein
VITHSPVTRPKVSSINLVSIFRCSSSLPNPVNPSHVGCNYRVDYNNRPSDSLPSCLLWLGPQTVSTVCLSSLYFCRLIDKPTRFPLLSFGVLLTLKSSRDPVNKEDLSKNLKFFNVTETSIQSIYSKLTMRVFDVCVNILKCMYSTRFSGGPTRLEKDPHLITSIGKTTTRGSDPGIRQRIQIDMIRTIRVDHTKFLQVDIKTHSF